MASDGALNVRAIIKPASRHAGVKCEGDILRVAVKSPPVEGRANVEATALIARAFGVPKSRVELVRGARSRIKQFRVVQPTLAPEGFESQQPCER